MKVLHKLAARTRAKQSQDEWTRRFSATHTILHSIAQWIQCCTLWPTTKGLWTKCNKYDNHHRLAATALQLYILWLRWRSLSLSLPLPASSNSLVFTVFAGLGSRWNTASARAAQQSKGAMPANVTNTELSSESHRNSHRKDPRLGLWSLLSNYVKFIL